MPARPEILPGTISELIEHTKIIGQLRQNCVVKIMIISYCISCVVDFSCIYSFLMAEHNCLLVILCICYIGGMVVISVSVFFVCCNY